jgi:hypothetical protein
MQCFTLVDNVVAKGDNRSKSDSVRLHLLCCQGKIFNAFLLNITYIQALSFQVTFYLSKKLH